MVYIRDVESVINLYGFDGKPAGTLKGILDIEREIIFDGINTLFIRLAKGHGAIEMEQEIIYKRHRYIVQGSEDDKGVNGEFTEIEAQSAQIELSGPKPDVNFEALTVEEGLQILLEDTEWEVGEIEDQDGYKHSMRFSGKSILYLIRHWARLSRHIPDYDTINRIVHFRRDTSKHIGEAFRYGKNIKEIKKTVKSPIATVLYPYGRGGLTIENVNEGQEFIEDYSWYESLGVPLDVARQKYKKEYIWEDNRFIYPGYLMAEAERRLSVYSRPQIAYEVPVSYIDQDIDIGDYAIVIDDEWGIKVETRIVRLNLFDLRPWENKVEFNYLIEGIHDIADDESLLDLMDTIEEKTIVARNGEDLSIGNEPELLLQISITSYSSFNAQVGLYLIGQASQASLFRGYFLLGGERVGPEIKQVMNKGYNTISLNFILDQIQEGSDFLEFVGYIESGSLLVELNQLEVYLKGQNLLGAVESKLPRVNEMDTLTLPNPSNVISITDSLISIDLEGGSSDA